MKQLKLSSEPLSYKTLLLALLIGLTMSAAKAQTSYLSVQVISDFTGSGLCGNVSPSLAWTKNQHTFNVGPNFQRKNMDLSGLQTNYRYTAARSMKGKFELYFSANFTYHFAARMSNSYVEIENASYKGEHPEQEVRDYSTMRLKVMESYAGFGLKANLAKNLSACAGIGMGAYHTCNKDYDTEMYREKSAVSMRFNFILMYHFKREVQSSLPKVNI